MNKQMKNMVILAVVGVVIYLVYKRYGSSSEGKAMASGLPCTAPNAPSTYVSGSTGCNFLENCHENGGIGLATQTGSGYELTCSKGGALTTSNNGSSLRPARRRMF